MFLLTGCIILAVGVYMFTKGRKKTAVLKKYEDENRLSDDTIHFDDIDASRTHTADRNLFRVITALGFFTGLFGLILVGYGLSIFTHTM